MQACCIFLAQIKSEKLEQYEREGPCVKNDSTARKNPVHQALDQTQLVGVLT